MVRLGEHSTNTVYIIVTTTVCKWMQVSKEREAERGIDQWKKWNDKRANLWCYIRLPAPHSLRSSVLISQCNNRCNKHLITLVQPVADRAANKKKITLLAKAAINNNSNTILSKEKKSIQDCRVQRLYVLTAWLWHATFAESLPSSFIVSHTFSHKGNSKHGRMRLICLHQSHHIYSKTHAMLPSVLFLMSYYCCPWCSCFSSWQFENI